jgi:hypothetical protein
MIHENHGERVIGKRKIYKKGQRICDIISIIYPTGLGAEQIRDNSL